MVPGIIQGSTHPRLRMGSSGDGHTRVPYIGKELNLKELNRLKRIFDRLWMPEISDYYFFPSI